MLQMFFCFAILFCAVPLFFAVTISVNISAPGREFEESLFKSNFGKTESPNNKVYLLPYAVVSWIFEAVRVRNSETVKNNCLGPPLTPGVGRPYIVINKWSLRAKNVFDGSHLYHRTPYGEMDAI